MTESAQNITAIFDFELICAGVLRMITDVRLLDKFRKTIDPDYFFYGDKSLRIRSLRKIMTITFDWADQKGCNHVSVEAIGSLIESAPASEELDEAKKLWPWILSNESIRRKSVDDGCFLIFMDYLKVTHLLKWSKPFQNEYKSGNISAAIQSMKDVLPTLDKISFDEDYRFNVDDLDKLIPQGDNIMDDVLLLGATWLDEEIGGFEKQTLTGFISVTNGGKSMMMQHLLRMCVKQKKTVHITCVEDRPKSFARRMIASLTGIPMKKLKTQFHSLTPEDMALIEAAKIDIKKYIQVDFVYGESIASVHKRKLDYDIERKAMGLPPYDVDIVDYTAHIASASPGDKKYEKIHTAYKERKDFVLKHNKIGFDAAQINREGTKSLGSEKPLSQEDLAGSFDMAQVFDTIISLNRWPALRDNNEAILHLCKGRDGAVGGQFKVKTDFSRARWLMSQEIYTSPSNGADVVQAINEVKRNEPERDLVL